MSLALIGYRGTGKSTVARLLALRWSCDWVDADVEVELRAGRSIATLSAAQGEAAFRDLESQVLADCAARPRIVLATGGGVVLRPENRAQLARIATVVWLTARPETLEARIAEDRANRQRRPAALAGNALHEIQATLEARAAWYSACAHFSVDTDDRTPAEVVEEIARRAVLEPSPGCG